MTLKYERTNAIENTREFLYSLLDPKKTPKVPREIRRRAGACLRHYPGRFDMEQVLAGKAQKVFGRDFEDEGTSVRKMNVLKTEDEK